jgi:hypothetical protein
VSVWHVPKAADVLPPDVTRFIEQRDLCDHFRGEPFEGDEQRREFIGQQSNKYCTGTDRELSRLREKYSNSSLILHRLEKYEPCIEASSVCR